MMSELLDKVADLAFPFLAVAWGVNYAASVLSRDQGALGLLFAVCAVVSSFGLAARAWRGREAA